MSPAAAAITATPTGLVAGYHSPQVDVEVRLNTNEAPLPPPPGWLEALRRGLGDLSLNRYPDRGAHALRQALADHHGVAPEQVFAANGSNEVIQCLLLAYGGPGRTAVTFEPTYALHSHIARLTHTAMVSGTRRDDFTLDPDEVAQVIATAQPEVTFLCSPNNPTGRVEPPELVAAVLAQAPGLVVVDEAYGQFSSWSALSLLNHPGAGGNHPGSDNQPGSNHPGSDKQPGSNQPGHDQPGAAAAQPGAERLVVLRTFSKTWAMAGARLGYLIGPPEVVAALEVVVLPYHLDSIKQLAGRLALGFEAEMRSRVTMLVEERGRMAAAMGRMALESWPSDANFILFRPLRRDSEAVWQGLLDRSVLIRDCVSWLGLSGCLRVTIGTNEENSRFLAALDEVLDD